MSETPRNRTRKGRNDDYLAQGAILAAAVVITKVIGVVYRIPLTNIHWEMRETGFMDMHTRYMRLL